MRKKIGIIGAGPAGSATAIHLLDHGIDPDDLVIFDRAVFPRPKLCGGAITFRGVAPLRALGVPAYGEGGTQGLMVDSQFGRLYLREPGPQLLFDRGLLDDHLLEHCRKAGVEVREGETVKGVEPGVDGWRIRAGRGTIPVSWVVGADGAAGITRRAATLRGGRTGRLLEGVFETEGAGSNPDFLHLSFQPIMDGIPGYAWAFPYPLEGSSGLWKVGIMDGRNQVPGAELRRWLRRFASERGFRTADHRLPGWPEHYYGWKNQAHKPGLVLVGEAHGVDPLLGEGIAPSLEMASFAAGQIKLALDKRRTTLPFYERRFSFTEEGRNLLFQCMLAKALYGPAGAQWLQRIMESKKIRTHGALGKVAYGRLLSRFPDLLKAVLFPRKA